MRVRKMIVWLGLLPNRGVGNSPYRFWHRHKWFPTVLSAFGVAIAVLVIDRLVLRLIP